MTNITKEDVYKAIAKYPSRYAAKDGTMYQGNTLSFLQDNLRAIGWRNVSRFDMYDAEKLGVKIIDGTYASGGKTGKYVKVAVLPVAATDDAAEYVSDCFTPVGK